MVEDIASQLQSVLHEDEWMLSLTQSDSNGSIYVLFRKGAFAYIPIRISNHKNHSYFSNKTFYTTIEEDVLLDQIRTHLDHSDWYIFKYEDYFTLKMLTKLTMKNLRIYVDNSMGIYDGALMGLLFYQIRYFNRNHKEMNTVSESFQKKYLRRLFAAGLLNGYRQANNDLSVYVTQMGKSMLTEYWHVYQERYLTDIKKIDYRYVEVPMDEILYTIDDDHKIIQA
ncbi:hypothetical protein LL019_11830 [Staphylococcus pseudintermedius]|uniref:hypothetical protein n=1 Tax=Staphylococcus pseudintermedius TaxID=283734 RepID=UPI001D184E41|nr:hypothetical protein [Staphylococcus pseudintermedius]MCC4038562.1 hypothetical protein [Staphylococcus pseudintermedius]